VQYLSGPEAGIFIYAIDNNYPVIIILPVNATVNAPMVLLNNNTA